MQLRSNPITLAVLAILVAAIVGLQTQPAAEAGGPGPTIQVSPSFQSVAVGGSVSVDIVVANAPMHASYEFHLTFDPSLLEFVSISGGGDIFEATGRNSLCFGPDADDLKNAIVSYACASTGGTVDGPSGSGVLATLTFDAICPSQAELAFVPVGKDLSVDAVNLGNLLGNSIDTQGVGGEVNINGAGCGDPGLLLGDANCDDTVDTVDAALILQFSAGLPGSIPCAGGADVNDDGVTNPLDAALILQFAAGLPGSLPP